MSNDLRYQHERAAALNLRLYGDAGFTAGLCVHGRSFAESCDACYEHAAKLMTDDELEQRDGGAAEQVTDGLEESSERVRG